VKRLAGLLAALLLLVWPLPRVFTSDVLTHPAREGAAHIWGLWAGLRWGPLIIESPMLRYPDGIRLVLVDPGNLVPFGVGGLLGPAAGYNLVVLSGVIVAGLGGWMIARHVDGVPWLGALAAMCCPPLLAATSEGTTEDFGVGWVLVFTALLLRGSWWAIPALTLAWLTGPYNGLWASLIGAALGAWWLVRDRRKAGRAALVGLCAAALGAPYFWAVLTQRGKGLPGTGHHPHFGHLPAIQETEAFRGDLWHGADLLDAWFPAQLTGGEAEWSHTAYVGAVALVFGIAAVRRRRELWPWLVASLAFSVVALGPWLFLGGEVLRIDGDPLVAPTGLALKALPELTRFTRWYRAGAVAALLLVPLVSTWRGPSALLVGGLLLADTLMLAPFPWPHTSAPMPDVRGLEAEGPLMEVPPFVLGEPPAGAWRDQNVLAQTLHGRPIAGSMMGLGPSHESGPLFREVEVGDYSSVEARGYTSIVVWKDLTDRRLPGAVYEDDVKAVYLP